MILTHIPMSVSWKLDPRRFSVTSCYVALLTVGRADQEADA